jgi:hypothetical protein
MPPQEVAIRVFPNPVHDQLSVSIHGEGIKPFTISIYNLQQVLVKQVKATANLTPVWVQDLSQGVYVIQVKDASGKVRYTGKVIKL